MTSKDEKILQRCLASVLWFTRAKKLGGEALKNLPPKCLDALDNALADIRAIPAIIKEEEDGD